MSDGASSHDERFMRLALLEAERALEHDDVPLDEVADFLADFAAPLVVEFPHRDDEMAARLLARKRDGLFDAYDRPEWEAALGRRFTVERRETLPGGTRTLYACTPR